MTDAAPDEFDAVVSPDGDVVIPSSAIRGLSLSPGQHVRVSVAAAAPVGPRRSMYGILKGQLPDISLEEMDRVSAEVWGEAAGSR